MRNWIWFLLMAGCALAARAQETNRMAVHAANRERVEAAYHARRERYRGRDDVLVRPGLVADRTRNVIRLHAEATGLDHPAVVEFFLIGENSSHAYEALAVSFAEPGDVHEALCFIGLTPGRPADPSQLRFWPKGERVHVTFHPAYDAPPVRAEELILDTRAGRSLESTGFVFTGATGFVPGDEPGREVYAANRYDPMSIAANYNEPFSVLDVPRRAPQSEVYERHVVNAAHRFDPGEFLEVVLEPEYTDGRQRVMDFVLRVDARAETKTNASPATTESGLVFELRTEDRVLHRKAPLEMILKDFVQRVEEGHDPFVTLQFDDGLAVRDVRRVSRVIAAIDNAKGIRVEAPLKDRLYYKAFLPDEAFRDRETRMAHPWELRLDRRDGGTEGVLTRFEEHWKEDQVRPDLEAHHVKVSTPADVRAELDRQGPGLPVILVFTEPAMRYGELLRFLRPALPTHGTVYVFSDPPS